MLVQGAVLGCFLVVLSQFPGIAFRAMGMQDQYRGLVSGQIQLQRLLQQGSQVKGVTAVTAHCHQLRIRGGECENTAGCKICPYRLFTQGLATSIDALSVGFTISEYSFIEALVSALIIAIVTFIICLAGVIIGKKFGTKLAGKAGLLGGIILIVIGIEIFIKGVFFS